MAKIKGIPNKHLLARATFLYQAATYLTLQASAADPSPENATDPANSTDVVACVEGTSKPALNLGAQLRSISRKGQLRLSAEFKRSICKSCNTILIPGHTSTHAVENKSRGGKKPCADILKISCSFCGNSKRYPIGATRQLGNIKRGKRKRTATSKEVTDLEQSVTPKVTISTAPSSDCG